jgi:hypothetical protein
MLWAQRNLVLPAALALYINKMRTRPLLVSISIVGVAATLIAVTEGRWTYGLALYGFSVAAILLLLRRALSERYRTTPGEPASSGAARPAAGKAGALMD